MHRCVTFTVLESSVVQIAQAFFGSSFEYIIIVVWVAPSEMVQVFELKMNSRVFINVVP